MTFRFEYHFYRKYLKDKETRYDSFVNSAGASLIIDDEFDTVELSYLNEMNEIINTSFISISPLSKSKIKKILMNEKIFKLNSYMYLDGNNKDVEQLFYFELDNRNRKVEGFNINQENINNLDVKLLLDILNEIALILTNDGLILKIDYISKK